VSVCAYIFFLCRGRFDNRTSDRPLKRLSAARKIKRSSRRPPRGLLQVARRKHGRRRFEQRRTQTRRARLFLANDVSARQTVHERMIIVIVIVIVVVVVVVVFVVVVVVFKETPSILKLGQEAALWQMIGQIVGANRLQEGERIVVVEAAVVSPQRRILLKPLPRASIVVVVGRRRRIAFRRLVDEQRTIVVDVVDDLVGQEEHERQIECGDEQNQGQDPLRRRCHCRRRRRRCCCCCRCCCRCWCRHRHRQRLAWLSMFV
jgi:hypothetical protein